MPVQLNNISGTLLPPTITGPIFDQANEASAVMQLARKVPLAMTAATAIPVPMDVPTPGWVSEGGAKPVSGGGMGLKIMTGKKLAVIIPVSEEVARGNPAGLYDQLEQDLPTGMARAFDMAAIHNKDLASGGAGPFGDYLRKGAKSIELGTATQAAGGMWADLVAGEKDVMDAGYDFSGFAADPRLRPTLKLQVDVNGRPIFVSGSYNNPNAADNAGGELIGYPAYFNRGVSGTYRRQGDTKWDFTITGSPTGGTWAINFGGTQITGLAYNISAAALQTAIRAALPAGNFATATVSGTTPYAVTLPVGMFASADGSGLTGGTNPAVSAAHHTSLDTTIRAVGGDFSQCAYGVGMDIRIDFSDQASYTPDGGTTWVSLWQNNMIGIRCEAYYGFVVSDNYGAFVQYTDAS